MSTEAPCRVLILEDSPEDAELIERALRAGGVAASPLIVGDEIAFRNALAEFAPAIILADSALAGFTGAAAVAIAREWDPAVPCILVSGALGEELAVAALRSGATDYVVKHRLELLAPAVRRALDESAATRDRERLTSELQRFSELTRETFERMPLGFVALDHEKRITYANPAALGLVGLTLAEVVGRRSHDLFPEVLGTLFQARETQTRTGLIAECVEYFAPGHLWVEVVACPTSAGVVVFLRDISDRKRSEEALRTSEALLRGSLDSMSDAFVVCSSVRTEDRVIGGFRVDFANHAAAEFMGLAPDTLIGAPIPDAMPHLGGAPFGEVCRRVANTGQSWTGDAVEAALPGPDGRRWALNIQITKFGDGFFAVWRDVTERERTRLERERLAAVVEQTLDQILVTDAKGIVAYANPALLAANHLTLAELVGRPAAPVVVELVGLDPFARLERTGETTKLWKEEIERRSANGATQHLEVSTTVVRDAGATVTSYVVAIHDVTDLRGAQAEVAVEARVRAVLAESLHNIPAGGTLAEASQAICDQLVTLPFVDVAAVEVFLGPDDLRIIAQSAPPGYPVTMGTLLPPTRATMIRERSAHGPWAQYVDLDSTEGLIGGDIAAGLKAFAYGPIVHGDDVAGVLLIGTVDEPFARTLVEKMPGIVAVGAASSAVLADRLYVMRREAELRRRLAVVLSSSSFRPVFQPIVDLESGEVVGYEALTRFDSGQRPDLCFADAWSVGLGAELEIAVIEAAVGAARALPAGLWLSVNLSPRALQECRQLKPLLQSATRPILLEITEHELIEDYDAMHQAIRALGHTVRVAVDDAGAGVANFGHIIELRPDFVKLDISLVRGVNTNLGRQAMVIGMRHFSRSAGCRLVAEGIETADEARTLTGLGVEFGQGYLYGRPAPAEVWTAAEAAALAARHPMVPNRPRPRVGARSTSRTRSSSPAGLRRLPSQPGSRGVPGVRS